MSKVASTPSGDDSTFGIFASRLNIISGASLIMERHLLTIQECRQCLGETDLTDTQILELRDNLCVLIDKTVDAYFDKKLQ